MHSHLESVARTGLVSGFANNIKIGGTRFTSRQSSRKKSGVMGQTQALAKRARLGDHANLISRMLRARTVRGNKGT